VPHFWRWALRGVAAMDAGQGSDPFNNISATRLQCEERQMRFYRFLNDYVVSEPADAEFASQASQASGGHRFL
jgi:hypothetical protein